MEEIWTDRCVQLEVIWTAVNFCYLREIDMSNDLGSRLSVGAGNSQSKNAIGLRMPFKRSVA